MIRTKQQADLHVADTLKRIRTKQERLLRGYQFAKLYFGVNEYEKAKEFLQGFLSIKDNSAPGHKLLGEIFEAQHHLGEAAAAFTKSLNIDQHQKDVLLKICDLYSQINVSPELAKVWAERGEQAFPTNDAIFKLKMKAHVANGDANKPEELLSFLVAESNKCPSDPVRRVKLLRSYLDLDRINEAYTHILEVEAENLHYDSLEWYRCVTDIFKRYRETSGVNINGKFHQMLLYAMSRLATLSIEQSLTIAEAVNALWSLDQELMKQGRSISSAVDELKALYQETEALYLFLCGALILNKAQKERLGWREASDLAFACFLVSSSVSVVDRKTPWYAKAGAESRSVFDRWYSDSCLRCSQTGHMLMQKYQNSDGGEKWIERIQDEYCHQLGQDKIFHILFTHPQQKDQKKQSYLTQCSLFSNKLAVPDQSLLIECDNVVHQRDPENLQLAVWTCLHYYSVNDKTQPKYPFIMFERLPYGVRNLDTAVPESLCQLDVLAFLYATVRTAALKHCDRCGRYDSYRPNMLPLVISEKLCTEAQREWWTSAYKLHTNNARDSLVRMRTALQRGLETIRILGTNLGMDAGLVVHLAQTFTEQLEESNSQFDSVLEINDNASFLQARAVHHWNKAIELLEKLEKNRSVALQRNPLFEASSMSLSPKHISIYLDEGRLFQAMEAKQAGRHNQAIKLFGQIRSPDAAFQSALLHKELAILEQASSQNESVTFERGHNLLSKAKNDLYETLDRLKGDRYHILNERVAEEIDDVETRLAQLGGLQRKTCFDDDDDDEYRCNDFSGIEKLESCSYRKKQDSVVHSTPQVQRSFTSDAGRSRSETRLRPSPDRLDAQIRSLSHGQDQWIKIIMDEMKENRIIIQKLQERVTLLESKLQDSTDQLKQYQAVAMATAVSAQPTLAPPAAMATHPPPPTAIMYQPSPFRGEGYEYWGSHLYDSPAALHGGLYRSYPHAQPAAYGVSFPGMASKAIQLPPHFAPSYPRLDADDYSTESYSFGQDHGHEFDHGTTQEPIKGSQAAAGVGFGSVSALQPGYFSVPKLAGNENEVPDGGVRQGFLAPRSNEEQNAPLSAKSDGQNTRISTSDSVVTIPNKPGVFKVLASSGERVLPAPSFSTGTDGKPGSATPNVAQLFNRGNKNVGEEGLSENRDVGRPHFEPIVSHPEGTDLKVAEGDETVLFTDRVRLSQFGDKQWKERGIGVLKILYNEKTRRARILMRHEQLDTVCADNCIRPDMIVERRTPGDETILTWSAPEGSGAEPQLQLFCCKFKTGDSASQFIENINKVKKLIEITSVPSEAKAPLVSVTQSVFATSSVQVTKGPTLLFGSAVSSLSQMPGKSNVVSMQSGSVSNSGAGGFTFGSTAFPSALVTSSNSATTTAPISSGLFKFSSTFTSSSVTSNLFPSSLISAKSESSATQPSTFGSAFSTSKTANSSPFSSLSSSVAHSVASVTVSSAVKLSTDTSSKFTSESVMSTTAGSTALQFGGFTFSKPPVFAATTPAASEKTKKEEKKESTKPNPFANFSFVKTDAEPTKQDAVKPSAVQGSEFGKGSSLDFKWPASGQGTLAQILKGDKSDSKAKSDGTIPASSTSDVATTVFGQSSSVSALSFDNTTFSALSGTTTTVQSKKVDDIFKNKGQRLFETVKSSEIEGEDANDETADDYVPDKSFEALVSLPEVEVMTGEENETKLFGERAKLYRMDNEQKQWKERGIGEIKILQHTTSKKYRILMRREQVLKVCANHYITAKMSLLPMKASENAWCWFARDFSEQEMREEQLAVKFKTAEQADKFKICFENCQRKLSDMAKPDKPGRSSTSQEKDRAVLTDKGDVQSSSGPLSVMFQLKEGEWSCSVCYVKNDVTKTKCASCESPKPGKKESFTGQMQVETIGPVSSSSLASLFRPKEGEWNCSVCYIKNGSDITKCAACESPKPGAKPEVHQPVSSSSAQLKLGSSGGFVQVETTGSMSASSSSLASLFKPKEGEWNCDVCYVKNGSDITKCAACESPKPGTKPEVQQPVSSSSVQVTLGSSGGFVLNAGQVMNFGKGFGSSSTGPAFGSSSTGQAFGSSSTGPTAAAKPVGFGQVPSTFGGFTFGNTKVADGSTGQPAETTVKPESVIKTGSENSKPLFGVATSTSSSNIFGGSASAFTFSGKGFTLGNFGAGAAPESQKPGDSTTEPDVAKPMFGNSAFSFSGGSNEVKNSPVVSSSGSATSSVASHKVFGTPSFSFAGVSAAKESSPFVPPSNLITPKKPSGAAAAAALSPASPQSPDGGFYRNTDGEDDHIVFEPIVKLPDNVEVKTGEEDEKILYCQRAKLYRYSGNEWKERGVGDVKILQNNDGDQVRLLMRREKVLKICLNHRLTPELSLKQMPNAEGKAWTWHAVDYADGESSHENFSIRFKDSQIAAQFKAAFNSALEHVKTLKVGAKKDPEGASTSDPSASNQQPGSRLLVDLLKKPSSPPTGSIDESDCEFISMKTPSKELLEKAKLLQLPPYFYNYLDSPDCPGCCGCDTDSFDFSQIGKPSQKPILITSTPSTSVVASPQFVFGSSAKKDIFKPAAPSFLAKPTEVATTPKTISSAAPAPIFGSAASKPLFGSMLFGRPASQPLLAQTTESQLPNASQPSIVFGSVGQNVDFASLASTGNSFAQSKSSPDFKWQGTGSTLFGNSGTPKSKTSGENNDEDEDGSGGEGQEDEDSCGITFTPLVQLPEVEVKTGEEEEEEVFRERGKLYRYDNGQWKERGIGDMKILKHRVNETFRLLLRREQVHKVACNHLLTADMKLQRMSTSETAWCWFAQDFAEGEAKMEKFALKFKTADIAEKFKERFEECQRQLSQPGQNVAAAGMSEIPSGGKSSFSRPETVASSATIETREATADESQDEEEDEQSIPIFSKRAQLKYKTSEMTQYEGGLGSLVVLEDDDVSGYRVRMTTDAGKVVCNHIICEGYEVKRLSSPKNACEWTALDFSFNEPVRKSFQVTFSSSPALVEFEKVFKEGVEMAVRSELSESRNEEFNVHPDESDDDGSDDPDFLAK